MVRSVPSDQPLCSKTKSVKKFYYSITGYFLFLIANKCHGHPIPPDKSDGYQPNLTEERQLTSRRRRITLSRMPARTPRVSPLCLQMRSQSILCDLKWHTATYCILLESAQKKGRSERQHVAPSKTMHITYSQVLKDDNDNSWRLN